MSTHKRFIDLFHAMIMDKFVKIYVYLQASFKSQTCFFKAILRYMFCLKMSNLSPF